MTSKPHARSCASTQPVQMIDTQKNQGDSIKTTDTTASTRARPRETAGTTDNARPHPHETKGTTDSTKHRSLAQEPPTKAPPVTTSPPTQPTKAPPVTTAAETNHRGNQPPRKPTTRNTLPHYVWHRGETWCSLPRSSRTFQWIKNSAPLRVSRAFHAPGSATGSRHTPRPPAPTTHTPRPRTHCADPTPPPPRCAHPTHNPHPRPLRP